jgi:S1-C subfamily serine protease
LNARSGSANLAARAGTDARARTPNFGGQFTTGTNSSLRVNGVNANGAMGRMGLRDGDEIVSVNGRNVRNQNDFQNALRDGSRNWDGRGNHRFPYVVRRNGRYQTLYWTNLGLALAGFGPYGGYGYGYGYPYGYGYGYGNGFYGGYGGYGGYGYNTAPSTAYYADTAPVATGAWLGVTLDPSYNDAAVVAAVAPGSPAEQIGIQPGDAIWTVNGDDINSHEELTGRIAQMQPGDPVNLTFGRDTERTAQAILGDRAARY